MTSSSTRADTRDHRIAPVVGLAWALKRALIGTLILLVTIGSAAWLLYAAIEPESADASESLRADAGASRLVAVERR
ncbi:MAG: hypothetical protein AB1749_00730 [Pseudomonadota bacterium]